MKVLALLVALVGTSLAEDSCFPGTFASSNFASVSNLRCNDAAPISVQYSVSCASYSSSLPRFTSFLTICDTDYTLIGYDTFACNSGTYASAIASSSVLSIHSSCVASSDLSAVCESTNSASSSTKLLLDVSNAKIATSSDSDLVYYTLSCKSGYSFKDGVDSSSVYGYCTAKSPNAYAFHANSNSDGCFAKCPANPAASLLSNSIDNLASLTVAESANGASNAATPVCSNGFDIADGTASTYAFTCAGALDDNANEGKVSCSSCPVCIATCMENPTKDLITDVPDNLASLSASQSKSNEVFRATPVCDDGFAIADNADKKYDYVCKSSSSDGSNAGKVQCDDSSCPICLAKCAENTLPSNSIDNLASININAGVANEEVVGTPICDSDHAIAYDAHATYSFSCSPSSSDGANAGKFSCGSPHECPVCETKCSLVVSDELSYKYKDGSSISSLITPGHNHIEVSCQNSSLKLIGERFASCKGGNVTYEDDAPICADADICEHPSTVNAKLSTNDNILAGAKYTVVCDDGYIFDAVNAAKYGSYTEGAIICKGTAIATQSCYSGCVAPDFSGGIISPDFAEIGQAPYKDGSTVEFSCLDGQSIIEGSSSATCESGVIAAPVCGACNLATTSILLLLTLFYILF